MLIFLLSLAGVPPLAGFIGKLYIFVAAIKEGLYTLITVGLINIVISMYYYLVIVKKMYINEPQRPVSDQAFRADESRHLYRSCRDLDHRDLSSTAADWVVSATLMFADLGSSAALPSTAAAIAAGH